MKTVPAALLTVPQACTVLNISRASLYRRMADRKNPLPVVKIGTCTRVDPVALRKWIEKK